MASSATGRSGGSRHPSVDSPMPVDIRVTVRLFASLREAAGRDRVDLTVPSATPVGAVWDLLPEGVARGAAARWVAICR